MKSKILKWLVPAPVAAGSVCLTMKLTNQANTSLLGLGELDLGSIPELKENELKPKKPPAPPKQQVESGGQGGNQGKGDSKNAQGGKQTEDAGGKEQKDQQSGGSSSSASGSQVSAQDLQELLKKQIINISTQSPIWIKNSGELSSVHSVISSVASLLSGLQEFKKQTQPPKPEAAPSGGAQQVNQG